MSISQSISAACGRGRWQLAICLIIGAAVSVAAGQDANWDLRNYHLATAYSLLTGQFDRDFFPADFQSSLNPTLDFPYVMLAMGPLAHYPRALAAFMGLWFGLFVFVVLRLLSLLFSPFPKPERLPLILLGSVTAVTGVAAFSQVGSTTGDIPVGFLILGGLWCVLRAFENPDKKFLLCGGFLFGLAAGCKITGAIYAPAICLALLAALAPMLWIRSCAIFSAGWIAGFLPPFSWWAWTLWSRFDSPTFPFLNNIFRSPWAPPLSLMDARFFPRDALQWIFYPFYWAWNARPMIAIEDPMRDPRMAIAYVALVAMFLGCVVRPLLPKLRKTDSHFGLTTVQAVTLAFLVLSYVAWLISSSIIRYAVPIEALSIPVAIIVIYTLAQRFFVGRGRQIAAALAVIVCAVSLAGTVYIDWPRVEYGNQVFDVDMSWTPPNTLFVSVIGPVAYLSAFVPPEAHARFVGFGFVTLGAHDWPVGQAIEKAVKAHEGQIEVLFTDDMRFILQKLPLTGLSPDLGPCRVIRSNIDAPLGKPVYACDARLLPP